MAISMERRTWNFCLLRAFDVTWIGGREDTTSSSFGLDTRVLGKISRAEQLLVGHRLI